MAKEQAPSSADYKNTLFLPKTDFPMRGNLAQREPGFLKAWEEANVYEKLMEDRKDCPTFILHDGPPYANANIHIGTALNKILKDFITRYKWLRGYRTPYVPGFDTHGMPIEHKVLKEAGLSLESMDPVELRERCAAYARHYVGVQTEEFKRLGVMGAWDRPYITLEPHFEASQLELFAEMVKNDYVYKGRKAIYWCVDCQTALAAAEIEYEDVKTRSIYVAYPFPDAASKFPALAGRDVSVIIWTTTPWTLPASLAVTVHAEYDYAFYEADGKVYLLAKGLKEWVEEATGLCLGDPLVECKGRELERLKAKHPFYDEREVLFALGDYVTLESGTGCVHTAPGHGVEDFETGIRYGLDIYNPVDPKGVFVSSASLVGGMSLEEGGKLIFKTLSESGRLIGKQNIAHSYPHCWRCKNPVIFRATDQWFVSVSKFKERTLQLIDNDIQWIPTWGHDRISNMVRDRSDWCISRQRVWGVPIPAFYCEDCGEVILTPDRIRAVAAKVREQGSNCWWRLEPKELLGDLAVCPKCKKHNIRKEKDIMDVWFDSGSSHKAVLENSAVWPELSFPADLYLEGSDQHRGWFQSSLLSSVAMRDVPPYKAVLTHGFIVDGEGKKMSKSLGNAVYPQEIVSKYGADILRLWVASTDYRGDIRISNAIIANLAESYRRIRNTARYLLANLNGFDPAKDALKREELGSMDQYILIKLARLIEKNTQELDDYEFHLPMFRIHQFCDNEMSSFYIDVSKDPLYADAHDALSRRGIRTVLWEVLKSLTAMIAPILCFTADEIWQEMRKMDPSLPENVAMAHWPSPSLDGLDLEAEKTWDALIEARGAISRALEVARSKNIVGHPLDAAVWMVPTDAVKALAADDTVWEMLSIVSSFKLVDALPEAEIVHQDETTGLQLAVSRNQDPKCPRCWKHRAEVREQEVCHRCQDALNRL